jgi:hypothetical protein
MSDSVEFVGGPVSSIQKVPGEKPGFVGIPVNEEMQPLGKGEPFAIAIYRQRQSSDGIARYHFQHFRRPNNKPFEAEFADGPHQGKRDVRQPPHYFSEEVHLPLSEEMKPFHGDGMPTAVAVYKSERSGKTWRFHLDRIDQSGETLNRIRAQINEQRIRQAAKHFYESPDYSIYTKPPTDEHPQVYIESGRRRAHVDKDIAPLVQALWQQGFETLGSCQQRPSGKAYIGFPIAKQGEEFHRLLEESGIESSYKEETLRLKNAETNAVLEVDFGNVLFSPDDIQTITRLLGSDRTTLESE